MRALSRTARRAAMAAGCTVVLAACVLTAVSASASPSPPTPARPAGTSLPFSACGYGVPKDTPLVVLVDARVRSDVPPKEAGFEATGPYDLVARHILGPFADLSNYSNCRVWLHQPDNPFDRGWTVCFNPRRFGSSPAIPRKYAYAGSMVISGNTNRCP
jgi:hypothetical protein